MLPFMHLYPMLVRARSGEAGTDYLSQYQATTYLPLIPTPNYVVPAQTMLAKLRYDLFYMIGKTLLYGIPFE